MNTVQVPSRSLNAICRDLCNGLGTRAKERNGMVVVVLPRGADGVYEYTTHP